MLPQYEISGILGRGGMGAVYKGRQANLERDVAIKLLPETFTKGDDELNFVARFKQEARAMARLDHPAILSVYDFGETANGQLYFVMEFVDGLDIHQYLHAHGGKLPQEQALAIVAHVLDALDYAHGHGIVHRDIKPANILLNREGRVKIADFGLAKRFGEGAGDSVPALTMTNVAVGTPDFVAPEALDSTATPDHRADLYAVGVMLYQLLTGKLPRGRWDMPSELDASLDPRLDGIVEKAMASNPDYRYPSAAAMRAGLDEIFSRPFARAEAGEASEEVAVAVPVTTSVRGGKPSQSASKSKTPLLLGVAAAAALVVVGWLVVRNTGVGRPSVPPVRGAAPVSAPIPPMPSTEKTTASERTPIASKPRVAPVESTAKMAVPPENSRASTLTGPPPPTPSTEKKPAPPVAAAAPKPAPEKQAPEPVAPPTVAATPPAKTPAASPPPSLPQSAPAAPKAPSAPPSDPAPAPMPAAPANAVPAPPPLPPELAALDAQFLKLQAERVAGPYEADLAKLNSGYLGGIAKRIAQEKAAGNLDAILALEAEERRLAAKEPVPESDEAGAPESLKALRAIYREAHGKLVAARGESLRALTGPLDERLARMEADFAKADRLADAKTVRGYREILGEAAAGVGAPAGPDSGSQAGGAKSAPGSSPPGSLAPAAALALKDGVVNTLGMKFLPVKGSEALFCVHETRYRDYAAYAAENPGIDGGWKNQSADGFTPADRPGDHPVMNVSWDDAQAFCAWLSKKEGKLYRLPTDREWSLAVGIGRKEDWKDDTTPATVFQVPDEFPWGDEWPPPAGAGNYSDASRQAKAPRDDAKYLEGGYDDGFPTTAPVMSFEANQYGLFDLGGNVWEWCEDWYSDEQKERVLRGGSWCHYGRGNLLSSGRPRSTPTARDYYRGFRVVVLPSSSAP